jgi:hypothetical protein
MSFIYLTPLIPLSFKEGEDIKKGAKPLLDIPYFSLCA